MTMTRDSAVDEYLDRLEQSLSQLPPLRRREIMSDIEEHLEATLMELEPDASEAEVLNALDRVGDPEDIANEARERFEIRSARPSWTDPLALVLLLVGGFLWLVGWVAGVVLLWLSDVWSTRDKIIGTLLVPGGLALPVYLLLVGLYTVRTTCGFETRPDGTTLTVCQGGTGGPSMLKVALFVLSLVGPIASSIYLGRKLRRARRAIA